MRAYIITVLLALVMTACTTAAPPQELPMTATASADCVNDIDWAYAAKRGAVTFHSTCAYCHGARGRGQDGKVPALAGNTALADNPERGIRMLLVTQSPAARTHGMEYDDMVAILGELDEDDLADVLTYVLSSWGNCAGPIKPDQIKAVAASM